MSEEQRIAANGVLQQAYTPQNMHLRQQIRPNAIPVIPAFPMLERSASENTPLNQTRMDLGKAVKRKAFFRQTGESLLATSLPVVTAISLSSLVEKPSEKLIVIGAGIGAGLVDAAVNALRNESHFRRVRNVARRVNPFLGSK